MRNNYEQLLAKAVESEQTAALQQSGSDLTRQILAQMLEDKAKPEVQSRESRSAANPPANQ